MYSPIVNWLGRAPVIHFLVFCIPVLMAVGLRFTRFLKGQNSWHISMARTILGILPICLSLAFLIVVAVVYSSPSGASIGMAGIAISSGIGIAAGLVAAYATGRRLEPRISEYLAQRTRKVGSAETRTDIRTVTEHLPGGQEIDLGKEFATAKLNDSIFLGVDSDGEPVRIDRSHWKRSHVQIMGPPGSGKGIQAAVTLSQSLRFGDAVYVFDPKDDEWAPSVFAHACEQASVPFHFISLQDRTPQLDPLAGASVDEIAEMLYAGFQLSPRGRPSDYYLLSDRKAARAAAELTQNGSLSLTELFTKSRTEVDKNLLNSASGFFMALEEVAELPCIQTREGISLRSPLEHGGCIYIVGSLRNDPVITLQKMLFVRIIQLIEDRSSTRHASIFLDEFKYLLSIPAINALGTVRDKGCNILLAHQSPGDFGQCGADLSESAVRSTVTDTTGIKWLYRPSDEATAAWISDQTGKILVEDQRRSVTRNPELAEIPSESRNVGEAERNLVDKNMVLSLPQGAAVCIGAGIARIALSKPIEVEKREFIPEKAKPVEIEKFDLLTRVSDSSENPDLGEPSLTDIVPRDSDPRSRLLCFLYEVGYTHRSIVSMLLDSQSSEETDRLIDELESEGFIKHYTIQEGYGTEQKVTGILKRGVDFVVHEFNPSSPIPQYKPGRMKAIGVLHQLDLQKLRIQAERAGWTRWRKVSDGKIMEKGRNYPDAVALRFDGLKVAVELERTVKTISRYPPIMLAHLEARMLGKWDEVYYISPGTSERDQVKKIFSRISELKYKGEVIPVTDDHREVFKFFIYDDDWTS